MADDLKARLRALAHERLQAEMHDHIPARGKKHQKLRIALAEGADRITALEDHARVLAEALRRHHEWHLKLGVVTFPAEEGQDEPTTLDMSAEYADSSLGEETRAALAEHQKIMEGK